MINNRFETETSPNRKKKSSSWVIWVLLFIGFSAGGYYYFNSSTAPTAKNGRPGINYTTPVMAVTARKGDINVTLNALGTVTPMAAVTVRTQINGQLMQVGFQEGQVVHEGDFLAEIDPRPYTIALAQAEGQLIRDQALLKDAEVNLARYKKLVAQDSLAKQQLDTQESLVQQYKGAVQSDQAQIDAAKLNLTYCRITAPVSGRVGLRQVDPGNYVKTSDTDGLVTITQLQPITVLFSLPEDNLPAIMQRLKEGATLEVLAYDRTQSTKLATGKLVSVDNQIDTSTGTIKLRAQFDNEDSGLFPNQFVNVRLLVNTLRDVTVIPTAAIQRGTPGTFVYRINEGNAVVIQKVKLGPAEGDNIIITEGLAPSDRVVIDGADKLREGAKVSLPEEKDQRSGTGDQR